MFPSVLAGEAAVDLLSLDLDGNDYWVLERLDCVRPRVAIVEFKRPVGSPRTAAPARPTCARP